MCVVVIIYRCERYIRHLSSRLLNCVYSREYIIAKHWVDFRDSENIKIRDSFPRLTFFEAHSIRLTLSVNPYSICNSSLLHILSEGNRGMMSQLNFHKLSMQTERHRDT